MNSKLSLGQSIFLLCLIHSLERASYYGARAILILHLTTQNFLSLKRDEIVSHIVLTGVISSFLLIPAGIISDFVLGLKRSISLAAIILTIGYTCLLIPNQYSLIGAAALIIIGSAFLKVNLHVQMGVLFSYKDERRDAGFFSSYFAINLGAFLGILCIGYLGELHGVKIGFTVTGILTFLIFLLFQLFKNQLASPAEGNFETNIIQKKSDQVLDINLTQINSEVLISNKKNNWVKSISLIILITAVFVIVNYWNGIGFSHILDSKSDWSIFGSLITSYLLVSTSTSVSAILMIPVFLFLYLQKKWTRMQILPFILAVFGILALSLYFIYFQTYTQLGTPLFLINGFSQIIELLFFSIMLSLITISSPSKFKATIMGFYLSSFALIGLLFNYFENIQSSSTALIFVGFASIIFSGIIWYFFTHKRLLNT